MLTIKGSKDVMICLCREDIDELTDADKSKRRVLKTPEHFPDMAVSLVFFETAEEAEELIERAQSKGALQ